MLLDTLMVRSLLRPLVACMQMFALYIVLHGHYSPGGGFQGGVVLGSSWILLVLVHGRRDVRGVISGRAALALSLAGAFVFVGTGIVSLLGGGTFLDYGDLPLPVDASTRRFIGILVVELGVAIAVAGVALSLFYSLGVVEEREVR